MRFNGEHLSPPQPDQAEIPTSDLTLRAWKLDEYSHPYGDGVSELISEERSVPVRVGVDRSLRAKVVDSCGMTCVFCHNEGTPVAADERSKLTSAKMTGRVSVFQVTNGVDFVPGVMRGDDSFATALSQLHTALDLNELHLTGGEPSLSPHLPRLIRIAREKGYEVKMTSNGENGAKHIPTYAQSGLSKINFSIFGTTPAELASVQNDKYASEQLAARKITALHRSIASAVEHGVDVAANVVVPDDSHFDRIRRILNEFEPTLELRLLPDLDKGSSSYYAIYKFLHDMNARPVVADVEAGSSNARVMYKLPDGRNISFKQIRATKLPEACDGCAFNTDELCKEGFYGTRLYVDSQDEYRVGVCIQRMDLTRPIDEFMRSSHVAEIINLRRQEYAALQKIYSDTKMTDKEP